MGVTNSASPTLRASPRGCGSESRILRGAGLGPCSPVVTIVVGVTKSASPILRGFDFETLPPLRRFDCFFTFFIAVILLHAASHRVPRIDARARRGSVIRSAPMSFAIVYVTGRSDPRLDWLIDGLEAQATEQDEIELIVVDSRGRGAAKIGFRPIAPICNLIETRPKPCVWQGDQRVTDVDWWALSNARNTGIVLCEPDYVVFLDDRCRIGEQWVRAVRRGAQERTSVLAGAYDKREPGIGGVGTRVTLDHRLLAKPEGLVNCGGGWLFGCAMALPLEWCLEVNGFEEGCDSLSGEDYIFGLMLANAGRRVDFVPDLRVHQDRMPGDGHGMRRTDKGVSPRDKSHAALERFGRRCRTEMTPDLRRMRADIESGGTFPDVDRSADHRDWFDDQPIQDLTQT